MQEKIDAMKYTDPRTPDPYDAEQLADLRKSRNPAVYDAWRNETAGFIKRNRGKLPW